MKLRAFFFFAASAFLPLALSAAAITDLAGNAIATGTYLDRVPFTANSAGVYETFILDATPPTISISAPSAVRTSSTTVTYTVTYADANFSSSTLSLGNITLNATGTAAATVGVTGSGTTRTVSLSNITGNGTLGISIAAGTASDAAGNTAPAAGASATFIVDNTPPSLASAILISDTALKIGDTATVTLTFTEPVLGLDLGDISAANADLSNLASTDGGTTWTLTLTPAPNTTALSNGLSVDFIGLTDLVGNVGIANGFSPSGNYTVDTTAPALTAVAISSNNANPAIARVGNLITLTFTPSEMVATPTVTIAGHSVTPGISGPNWIATYTMTSGDPFGAVPFNVAFTDLAGNPGTAVTATTDSSAVIFGPDVPGAPTIGTATAGVAQASITFTAPVSDGGATITGYTVTSNPGNVTASGALSPIAVTGLTNGTAYTFTVTATNSVGTSAASAASNSVTPLAPDDYTITTTGHAIVVTDVSGHSDTLTIDGTGAVGTITFAAPDRGFKVDGAASVVDAVTISLSGVASITVDAGAGDDLISVGTLPAQLPSLTIDGGSGDDTVDFTTSLSLATNANLDVNLQDDTATPGSDQILVDGSGVLATFGSGTITLKASKSISLASGSAVRADDGNITLEANRQATVTSGDFHGVFVQGTVTSFGSGTIGIHGRSGNASAGKTGVRVTGVVNAAGSGTIEIDGALAPDFTGGAIGVSVQGGAITSASGGVFVVGDGTGATGTGNSYGILVSGATGQIGSVDGDVSVTGTAPASAGAAIGIYVATGSTIKTTGTGKLDLFGTGGATTGSSSYGVFADSAGTTLSAAGSPLTITGHGGAGFASSIGIYLPNSAAISNTASGTITLIGDAGASSSGFSQGVRNASEATIASANGAIAITGTGGNGAAGSNFGASLRANVQATGSGGISLTGTAGSGTGSQGLQVRDGATVSSSSGNVTLTGTAANGTGTEAIAIAPAGTATLSVGSGHTLSLVGDSIAIDPANATVGASNAIVAIHQKTAATAIDLGGADAPGTLGLTDAELDRVTAGTLNLGDASSGALTIGSGITRPSLSSDPVNLTSGSTIAFNAVLGAASGNVKLTAPHVDVSGNGNTPDVVCDTLSFGAGTILDVALNASSSNPVLGVNGRINLNGVTLALSGAYTPANGNVFRIANNDLLEAIAGTFTGLAQNAVIANVNGSGRSVRISYTGGDGNDVDLTTLSNDADLSALSLGTGSLDTSFSGATTNYTASVLFATTSLTLTPTRSSSAATIEARVGANAFAPVSSGSPSSSLALAVGANTLEVRVTAEDGTQKTYTLTVTRGTPFADLSITATDGVATTAAGGSVTYTIVVANAGPDAANGAAIADTFPAALTNVAWTAAGAGGGSATTASGSGNLNHSVDLPSGGSVTFTVSGTLALSATGTLSNTATIAVPAGVTDPTPGNNSATDSDTIDRQADLAITITDGVTTATAGGSVTYTITASNPGPSNATGATVALTFPDSLTATWTSVGLNGGSSTASGSGNIDETVNLPAGGSVTYTATCAISFDATDDLSTTATIAAPDGVTDPTPGNDKATDIDTISNPPPAVTSLVRAPSQRATTGADTCLYVASFSKPVLGVGPEDFVLTTVSGTATGRVSWTRALSETDYEIAATNVGGAGVVRVDLAPQAGIVDALRQSIDPTGVAGGNTVTHLATRVVGWGTLFGRESVTHPVFIAPPAAPGDRSIVSVQMGSAHMLFLGSDGLVFASGENSSGQAGVSSSDNLTSPVPIDTTDGSALAGKFVIAIAAGEAHSLALASDGTVAAWGLNNSGQLGDGTTINRFQPVAVDFSGRLQPGERVIGISGGVWHSAALTSLGRVFAWGENTNGQLGNGTTTAATRPVAVDTSGALSGRFVTAISAGAYHTLALTRDGGVFGWGHDIFGELGSGSPVLASSPVAGFTAATPATAIAAGFYTSYALGANGSVYAAGYGRDGNLGDGTNLGTQSSPVRSSDYGSLDRLTIREIGGSLNNGLAVDSQGMVHAWGTNYAGQLGNDSDVASLVPVAVSTAPSSALYASTVEALGHPSSNGAFCALAATSRAFITGVSSPADGYYVAGSTLTFAVTFDRPVTLDPAGGAPTLPFADGPQNREAALVDVSSDGLTLTFRYAVLAGDSNPKSKIGVIGLSGFIALHGATLKDANGDDAVLAFAVTGMNHVVIDTAAPAASVLRRATSRQTLGAGAPASVVYEVEFSEPITGVTAGSFTLDLSPGVTGAIDPNVVAIDSSTYTITITGVSGDGSLRLDTKSAGSGIVDFAGNALVNGTKGETYFLSPLLAATYDGTSADGGWAYLSPLAPSDGSRYAQLFTTPAGLHDLRGLTLSAWIDEGTMIATLHADDHGHPASAVLATLAADLADSGSGAHNYSYTAGGLLRLDPETTYWLVLEAAADSTGHWIGTSHPGDYDESDGDSAGSWQPWATVSDEGPLSLQVFGVDSDTTPPDAPIIAAPLNGATFAETMPVASGTAEPDSTVTLIADGVPVDTARANGKGDWSMQVCPPLADGPHTLKATATDTSGNVSDFSATVTFTVDTLVPAAPVLTTSVKGGLTNDPRPTFSGTAENDSTVTVLLDGGSIGTTVATGDGKWTFTPSSDLAEGTRTVKATATDAAGNTSAESNTATFTLDTTPPAAPSAPDLVTASDSGASGTDNVTKVTKPTFSGTAEVGSTVTLYDGATPIDSATTLAGAWSLTLETPLVEGTHAIAVKATDAAGNTSSASLALTVTIDTTAPVITNNPLTATATVGAPFSFTITASGSPVSFDAGGLPSGLTLSGATIAGTPTVFGTFNLALSATDAAGNTGTATLALTILGYHSADTNRDWAIDLGELTRVIELYNTRSGSERTGAYRTATGKSEDGYEPGAGAITGLYHSADSNRDGMIDLPELLRVIELYNTNDGTTRTGAYRRQSSPETEDGFAPGPGAS